MKTTGYSVSCTALSQTMKFKYCPALNLGSDCERQDDCGGSSISRVQQPLRHLQWCAHTTLKFSSGAIDNYIYLAIF